MNKKEYLELLKKKLSFADRSFVESLVADFEAHFESGIAEGLSEAEIISHLGDIDEIVESLDTVFDSDKKAQHNEEFVSGKVNHVVVDAKFADVTFTPSSNDRIDVKMISKGGLISRFTNTMIGEQKGDVFEIRVIPLFNVNTNVDMKISVTIPSTLLSCKVLTSSGDVHFDKISFDGDCLIKSASGDVSVTDSSMKSYDFQVASSDVTLVRSVGDVKLKSASGDVFIKEGRGVNLDGVLASGDMSVVGFYQKVNVKTVSGSLNLELDDASDLSIATVNGFGKIKLTNMDSIRFDVTSVSGFCKIQEPAGEHKLKNRQHLILKEGSIPCKISTVNGEIEVNMG